MSFLLKQSLRAGSRRSLRIAGGGDVLSCSRSYFLILTSLYASPFASASLSSRRFITKRAMNKNTQSGQLWNSNVGIRFSPGRELKPLYPALDVSRFVHIPSADSNKGGATNPVVDIGNFVPPAGSLSNPQEAIIAAVASNELSADVLDLQSEDIAEEAVAAANGDESQEDAVANNGIVEPPWTSLQFNISTTQFHTARAATVGSTSSFWSHTMYEKVGENGQPEKVKVHYCLTKDNMEYVCKKHFADETVLGFDIEWIAYTKSNTGGPRENVSLIQIASPSRIALFHIAMISPKETEFIGPEFRKILEDPTISKVGVNIRGDCTRVRKYLDVTVQGIFELSHLYKVVKFLPQKRLDLINKTVVSMAKQVQDQLRLPLYKGQNVRESDWTKILNERQLKYSASDAYAGIQLFHVLDEKRKAMDPCPPRPHHAELELPIPIPAPPVVEKVDTDVAAGGSTTTEEAASNSTETVPAATKPKTPRKSTVPSKRKSPSQESSSTPQAKPKDPRITAADLKLQEYRSLKETRVTAPPASLRSYYIWLDNDNLNPVDIAKLLRDPPLQTATVVGYILDAISTEKLPYPKTRLNDEVLSRLHPKLVNGFKFGNLVRECRSALAANT